MQARQLTQRERAVLDALLAIDFPGVDALRRQAAEAAVVATCGCGCPSIDFQHRHGLGMATRANARVRGTDDGLFLYTIEDPGRGEVLGGIEWVGVEESDPDELPPPDLLEIWPT